MAQETTISKASTAPRIVRPESEWAARAIPNTPSRRLSTDREQYDAMRASFRAGGFKDEDCEYLFVDNTGPLQTDAYRGLNALLNAAAGALRHPLPSGRAPARGRTPQPRRSPRGPDAQDQAWALAGNAGGVAPGKLALRISDPHGRNVHVGELPARVASLDENFIVVRREARVGFSRDLSGFHFYGADICLHAAQMGFSRLRHRLPSRASVSGTGRAPTSTPWNRPSSTNGRRRCRRKWLQTTCALVAPFRRTGRRPDRALRRKAGLQDHATTARRAGMDARQDQPGLIGRDMHKAADDARISAARFGAQGAMLFTGYGLSQAMSFCRNAMLGHALSPRDFGIAASIALLLQLVETLSDLGSDRLIVQADDGNDTAFIATTHTVLAARGVILALVMVACGPFAAQFFGTPEATEMFLWAAAVPLIKGFSDLDCRRAQRHFDNRRRSWSKSCRRPSRFLPPCRWCAWRRAMPPSSSSP